MVDDLFACFYSISALYRMHEYVSTVIRITFGHITWFVQTFLDYLRSARASGFQTGLNNRNPLLLDWPIFSLKSHLLKLHFLCTDDIISLRCGQRRDRKKTLALLILTLVYTESDPAADCFKSTERKNLTIYVWFIIIKYKMMQKFHYHKDKNISFI